MSEERQTVAGAYAKIESHEDICAIRYSGINSALEDLKGLIRWILGGVATVALALIAWMAVQLYTANSAQVLANSARIGALEHPSPAPVTTVQVN